MTKHTHAIEWLKKQGLRLTPQRVMILAAVAEGGGHMSVEEIHERAKQQYPYIDIATVYRTLSLLKKMGVVTEVGMGDRLHFELTSPDRKHHHMVCHDCGNAFDLSPVYLDKFRKTLIEKFGFEPDLTNFTITGLCADCAQRAAAS